MMKKKTFVYYSAADHFSSPTHQSVTSTDQRES